MLSSDERRAIAWAASSIYERATRAQRNAAAADSRTAAVFSSWNQAFAPGDPQAFERRLSWDGLDKELIASAVSRSQPDVDAPAWTQWLVRFDEGARSVAADFAADSLPELRDLQDGSEPPFVELWVALLRAGRAALDDERPAPASGISPRARDSLERQLLRELSVYGELAAYELFRTAGRYRAFIGSTLDEGFATLWNTFPVLARQLALVVDAWVTNTRQLIDRLERDRAALELSFNAGSPLGMVDEVEPGLSDPHDGRRRVAILQFGGGMRIVYKPRDLGIDDAFAHLTRWFTEHGLNPSIPAVRALKRPGCGWTEYVQREDFSDKISVSRYYQQAGSLLFLAHLLGARDLHMENLVARRAGPTLIDLELLLQPIAHVREPQVTHETADGAGTESCLRTGLLTLFELGPGDEVFDLGGLRGTGATPGGAMRRRWIDLRTDAIRFVEEALASAAVNNTVALNGSAQLPEGFPNEVLAGFERAYHVALTHRDALLGPTGPLTAFDAAEVRVLVRPTNQYGVLSAIRNVPRYQRDGIAHSIVVDALHRPLQAARERPREWPVVVEERRVTEALDVPRFVVAGDGRTVYSNGQAILHDYYALSPVGAVRDRIARLSERDCRIQRQILARAAEQSTASRFVTPYRGNNISRGALVTGEELTAHALWIADELLAHGTRDTNRLAWLPKEDLERVEAHSLYDGAVGPGLFFAALAAVTGEERWHDTAHAALAPTVERVEAPDFFERAGHCAIGGCSGLGSIVHALARAGALLGPGKGARSRPGEGPRSKQAERLLSASARVASAIDSRLILADRYFDVVDGSAGAVLALLTLHDIRASEALVRSAIECGDHLIASHLESENGWAWPSSSGQRLAGFAHGSAGVATALMRLSATTGLARYRDAALHAFEFVAGLFGSHDGNWPVAKPDPANVMTIMGKMNAWCHGAPGIVGAVLTSAKNGSEPPIVEQARRAITTVERWGAAQADHLCCGHLGRADALITAGASAGIDTIESTRDIVARVLTRARARHHFRLSTPGVEYIVFSAGFFRGLSGIGYQLLRLANPERVPSILFFG